MIAFNLVIGILFFRQNQSNIKPYELSAAAAILQHGNRLLQNDTKPWKSHTPKQHGAARLFNYLEASDSSEPECDSRGTEDMNRITTSHRIQSDFHEAGDVGSQLDEPDAEDVELPLFVCKICGCEFEDDSSLETHQFIHCHSSTSPAKAEDIKENVNPKRQYQCYVCQNIFSSQSAIMEHMTNHSVISYQCSSNSAVQDKESQNKRSRKQSFPKKLVVPFLGNDECSITWDSNDKLWRQTGNFSNANLYTKYLNLLVTRKGFFCKCCRNKRLSQFRTKGNLFLHKLWKQLNNGYFQCEHCNLRFKHRYQSVLHSSRVHITKPKLKIVSEKIQVVPTKEPIIHPIVPVPEEASQNFLTHTFTAVPDITNTSANVHKLGMSFLDHPFLHSNSSINGHMPIIIPTFPPN